MNSRKESLMYFVAMLMSLLATFAAWAAQTPDAAREALADEIAANVGAATENAARLREKALKIRVEAAKVRTGEWDEVWPGVSGMVTNRVAGEIWNDAIQAAIDAHGAVYVPEREKPYYLDGPIVLSSGQAFVADKRAEFRLVPGVDMAFSGTGR